MTGEEQKQQANTSGEARSSGEAHNHAQQDAGDKTLPSLTRRGFLAGALGAGATVVAATGEALLTGCARSEEDKINDLATKAVEDKDVPVVEVSPEQIVEITDFEEAPFEDYLELIASYELPPGSLVHQISEELALVLKADEKGGNRRQIGIMDLITGEVRTLVKEPVEAERGVIIYDARASKSCLIWVELNLGALTWKTYVAAIISEKVLSPTHSLVNMALGDVLLVEEGGVDYEPPMLAVFEDKAYWTVMPYAAGKANMEDSYLKALPNAQKAGTSKAEPYTVFVSHGRMITNPLVSGSTITLVPRVDTANIYYQLTALNCSDDKAVAFQVLPFELRVSDAVLVESSFLFSIEGNYTYAGGLSRFGIYQQLTDGNYLHVSKPPTNAMVRFGDCLLFKSTSSIIGVDPEKKKLFVVKSPPRCSDFGEALVGGGAQTKVVTCSIRMKEGGQGAEITLIRVFGKAKPKADPSPSNQSTPESGQ